MSWRLLPIVAAVVVVSWSCASKAGAVKEIAYKDVIHREEGELRSYVMATYPRMIGPLGVPEAELNQAIRRRVMELSGAHRKFIIPAAARQKKRVEADPEQDGATMQGWMDECTYFLGHLSESTVSLCIKQYGYTGGAHGNWNFHPINYQWTGRDVEEVALHHLFDDGKDWEPQVAEIAWNAYVDLVAGKRVDEEYLQHLKDVDGSRTGLHNRGPFTFSSKGITFYFAPYVLNSFAFGDFQVLVPLKEIEHLLDPEGSMGRWMDRADLITPNQPAYGV